MGAACFLIVRIGACQGWDGMAYGTLFRSKEVITSSELSMLYILYCTFLRYGYIYVDDGCVFRFQSIRIAAHLLHTSTSVLFRTNLIHGA